MHRLPVSFVLTALASVAAACSPDGAEQQGWGVGTGASSSGGAPASDTGSSGAAEAGTTSITVSTGETSSGGVDSDTGTESGSDASGGSEGGDLDDSANIVFSDDFDYTDGFGEHGWNGGGSSKFFHETDGCLTDGCVRIRYDEGGTSPYWFGVNVEPEELQDFTVRFHFRVVGSPALGGAKFFKVFGAGDTDNYANTTIRLVYESGDIDAVGYGPGMVAVNDAQAKISFSGTASDELVEVVSFSGNFTPPEGTWHEFRAYMRYNSDGLRDGEYRVWIDDVLRVHARNVRNRHPSNAAYPRSIDLANYTSSDQREHDWDLWYDDIEIYRGLVTP